VYQFDGRSLGDPPLAAWRLRADGGRFDQLTGASVTPRAVVRAIRETLLYFDAHQAEIFDMPATADSQ
jgi:electron transport complex protein RnfG